MKAVERVSAAGLAYYTFAGWDDVRHGIFTRHGGASAPPFDTLNLGGTVGDDPAAVRENHARMVAALDVDGAAVCTVWQVHTADVIRADAPAPPDAPRWLAQADGIVTDRPGLPLAMRFADCVPVLLFDPVRRAIGIAHAGWRGTVQGVSAATVRRLADEYGSRPEDIRAGIGPSISQRNYQVGDEVVAALEGYYGTTDDLIRRDPDDGTAYLDLWAANRRDLERAGVRDVQIAGLCTAERTDEFFSHRAEHGTTGRFGAVISL